MFHLLISQRQIKYTQVELLERKSQDVIWDINDPPDIFYDVIEDLITISKDANSTKTNNELISYRLKIIQTTGDFENRLLIWYKKI